MGYKSILVHCDASAAADSRIALACDLAARYDSHLIGLHIRPQFQPPMMYDGGYGMDGLYQLYDDEVKADLGTSAAAFRRTTDRYALSTEWRVDDGLASDAVILHARYADLIVVGQTNPDAPVSGIPSNLPEAVALWSGRPVLVVPYAGAPATVGKTIMLCWNASREAARAATDALPILQAARHVIVMVVGPRTTEQGNGPEPGADVAAWLSRHGVKISVQREAAADDDVTSVLLSRAVDLGVDLIVMGAYGHSRVREMVLGGVSRSMLATMTVPVLMAH